jgi:hypothetical protein
VNLVRFWHALESVPGLRALRVQWEEHLGPEIEAIGRLLRTTSQRAERYPCPDWVGDNCPRIVDGDIAFCGNLPPACEDIPLQKGDALIREVDISELIRQIASGLGLRAADPIRDARAPGRWRIGIHGATHGPDLPVHLLIQLDRDGFYRATSESLVDANGPLLLLAPTSRWLDARLIELLRGRGSSALALADLLEIGERRVLAAKSPLDEALTTLRTPVGPAENVFEQIAGGWRIRFQRKEDTFRIPKGLLFLRVLLRHPGEEFEPAEIANLAGDSRLRIHSEDKRRSKRALEDEGLDVGSSEEELREKHPRSRRKPDPAREWAQQELVSVRRQLEKARAGNNQTTIAALEQKERALGGFPRPVSSTERIVTPRMESQRVVSGLKYSLEKIHKSLPKLWAHLEVALVQGPTWCYRKHLAVRWQFLPDRDTK